MRYSYYPGCTLKTRAKELGRYARLSPADGNAAYRDKILDAVYRLTPAQLEEGARYELR